MMPPIPNGDGLSETILLRNLEVNYGRRFVTADLEHGDGVVGPVQGLPAVGRGLDSWVSIQRGGDAMRHDLGRSEPLRVDVVQADRGAGEFGKAENIAQQIPGEHSTPGPDERDLGHIKLLIIGLSAMRCQHRTRCKSQETRKSHVHSDCLPASHT
jgi:hypothetical protein